MPFAFFRAPVVRAVPAVAAFLLLAAPPLRAQESGAHDSTAVEDHDHHDHDGDHGPVHFSHPLVAESPSPDTKLRLDYATSRLGVGLRTTDARLEGEYAFTPGFSIEASLPWARRAEDGLTSVSSLGSASVALKAASFRLAHHGVILGGGLETSFPTGSDRKEIGSAHLVELEPFVDAGWRSERVEAVAFARTSATVHRRDGEDAERALGLAASLLYHLTSRVETLVETDAVRALAGEESGTWATVVAPGIKAYPLGTHSLCLGLSMQLPVTQAKAYDRALMFSLLHHF